MTLTWLERRRLRRLIKLTDKQIQQLNDNWTMLLLAYRRSTIESWINDLHNIKEALSMMRWV